MFEIFNGRYKIVKNIGKGSQSETYLAEDLFNQNRKIVIKLYTTKLIDNYAIEEFRRLSLLDHPQIVKIYDIGKDSSGRFYIIEKWIEGKPSDEIARNIRYKKDKKIFSEWMKWFLIKSAMALNHIHTRGILHRDIKPAHLIVKENDYAPKMELCLIDFGLASGKKSSKEVLCGTPGFIAPECLKGYYSPLSDLYALGITAFVLSGGEPFDSDMKEHHPKPIHPLTIEINEIKLTKLEEILEKFLLNVIKRLMNNDPFLRFPSAKALMEHLTVSDRFASGIVENPFFEPEKPLVIGRNEIIKNISGKIIKRITGNAQNDPAATILKGPVGIGKSTIINEIKKNILLHFASLNDPIPLILESNIINFASRNLPNNSTLFFDLQPFQIENIDNIVDSIISASVEKKEGIIAIISNPQKIEVEIIKKVASKLFFSHAKIYKLFFLIELDTEQTNKESAQLCNMDCIDVIEIPPLNYEETEKLLESILGTESDPSLIEILSKKSGGIPLFAEQLAFYSASKHFKITENEIPGAVKETIFCYLKQWTPGFLEAAGCMALSVNPVTIELISLVCGLTYEEITKFIDELSRKRWIEAGTDTFSLHPLVANAINEFLSPQQQELIHNKIALAIEKIKPPNFAGIAGYHFFMSGNYSSVNNLVEEVERMMNNFNFEGAMKLIEEPLRKNPLRLGKKGLLIAARLLRETGNYEKALNCLNNAETTSDSPDAFEKKFEYACISKLKGNTEEAKLQLEEIISSPGVPKSIYYKSIGLISRIFYELKMPSKAISLAEKAINATMESSILFPLIETLAICAISEMAYNKARDILTEGLKIAKSHHAKRIEARFNGLMGILCQNEGKFEEATSYYELASADAKECGDRHAFSAYSINLGSILMDLGNFSVAFEKFKEARRVLETIGGWKELCFELINEANLHLRTGNISGAHICLNKCDAITQHYKFEEIVAVIKMLEGDILFAESRFLEASSRYEKAATEFFTSGNQFMAAQATLSSIESLVFADHIEEARKKLESIQNTEAIKTQIRIKSRATFISAMILAKSKTNINTFIQNAISALDEISKSGEKELILQGNICLYYLLISQNRIPEAEKHLKIAIKIAEEIRNESLKLGYDPVTTNPYMKLLRRETKMKESMFGPFSIEESSSVIYKENKWARLARINKRINSELRPRILLEVILDNMMEITGAARGFIILKDKEGNLKTKCVRNMETESKTTSDASFSNSIVKKVIDTCKPVITVNASDDDNFTSSNSVLEMNLKSVMAVPLLVKGKLIGAVYLDNPYTSNIFDKEDVNLLMTFADQAAIALENSRLMRENLLRERKIERLNRKLQSLLAKQKIQLDALRETIERSAISGETQRSRYSEIIGESKPMQKIFRLLDRICATDLPAVIVGESGTGKELVARAIHFNSSRKSQPFITENCGAIPDSLLESVLFGHMKGAFTGADRNRAGLFEMANGGTLFLDEIDSMSLQMQTKLLRTLQDGSIRPLGSEIEKTVDVRVIAASGSNLDRLVKEGKFREDLFYRINVICIEMPPLRERKEDIPLLVNHFIQKHGKNKKIEISVGAMKKLMEYDWPGNVRQLENEIMRAIVLCEGKITDDILLSQIPVEYPHPAEIPASFNLKTSIEKLEKTLIKAALDKTGGNQSAAARLLGISRFGLIKKMERLGMENKTPV